MRSNNHLLRSRRWASHLSVNRIEEVSTTHADLDGILPPSRSADPPAELRDTNPSDASCQVVVAETDSRLLALGLDRQTDGPVIMVSQWRVFPLRPRGGSPVPDRRGLPRAMRFLP